MSAIMTIRNIVFITGITVAIVRLVPGKSSRIARLPAIRAALLMKIVVGVPRRLWPVASMIRIPDP